MRITWLGHAAFKLESNSCSIVFDPYKDDYVPGLSNIRETADIVLMSHIQHDDHNGIEAVCLSERYTVSTDNSEIRIMDSCSGKPVTDVIIKKLETFHDHHNGKHRGSNTIHVIEADGFKLAHMGDIGFVEDFHDNEAFKMLLGLDLLILPVGGFYTIDAEEAVKYIQLLKPRMVIPMHFRNDVYGFGYDEIATVDDFIMKLKEAGIVETAEETTRETTGKSLDVNYGKACGVNYQIEITSSSFVELKKNDYVNPCKTIILTPRLRIG